MNIIQLIAVALASIYAVHWSFPKILRIAKVKGLVDNPDARKLQQEPIPVLGGIAVFFGLLFGLLCYDGIHIILGLVQNGTAEITEYSSLYELFPVLVGSGIMLYVGAFDDIMGLSPRARLVIEVMVMLGIVYGSGMCVDSFHGLWGIQTISWWIAVPITVFAGVGIINAYNMIDGVNGLSSGLCIACSGILGIIFFKRGDFADAALALCFAGALVPFYLHNVFGKSSKMFIGDAGTMVMGLMVSWFIIRVLSSHNGDTLRQTVGGNEICLVAMMLAIASVPVFDTLRVMTARMMKGGSPFKADKTHLHHIFIITGVSHLITGLSELLMNLVVVAMWYISYKLGVGQSGQLYATIASAAILVWGTYLFLHYQEIHNTIMFQKFNRASRFTHLGGRHWWVSFQKWLDSETYSAEDTTSDTELEKQL